MEEEEEEGVASVVSRGDIDLTARGKKVGSEALAELAFIRVQLRSLQSQLRQTSQLWVDRLGFLDESISAVSSAVRARPGSIVHYRDESHPLVSVPVPERPGRYYFVVTREPDGSIPTYAPLGDLDGALRSMSVRVYLSGARDIDVARLFAALQEYFDALGYLPPTIDEVAEGSLFTSLTAKLRHAVGSREARILAEQARHAAEAWTAERADAENVSKVANSIANVLGSTEHLDSLSMDLGVAHVAVYTDDEGRRHGIVKAFSSRERAELKVDEKLKQPEELYRMMKALEETADGDANDT